MTMVSNTQIVDNLTEALDRLKAERDAEVERVRKSYQDRIDSLQQAISAIRNEGTLARSPIDPVQDQAAPTVGAIGPERLEAIREYVLAKGRVRQADIATALGFNTGTVSVATRMLQEEGVISSPGKERGSRVWEVCVATLAAQASS